MPERCIIIAKSTKQQCKNYAKKGSQCCSVHQKQCLEVEPSQRAPFPQPGPSSPPRALSPPRRAPSPQPGPSRASTPPQDIIEILENACTIVDFTDIKNSDEALYVTFLEYATNKTIDIGIEEMINRVKDKLKEERIKTKEIKNNIDYLRYLYLYSLNDEIAIKYCDLSNKCDICAEFRGEFIELHRTEEGIVHKICKECFYETTKIKKIEIECPYCRKNVTTELINKGIFYVDELIKKVIDNPEAIQDIQNPSEEVQLAAVEQVGIAIRHIIKKGIIPSEVVKLAAVKNDGIAIGFIPNASEALKLAAVQQAGQAIQYIRNPSEEVKLAAVQQDGFTIYYIQNPSEALKLAAVQQDGYAIEHILNSSEEVQLAAVQQDGNAIQYIPNPSEVVKLAAVQQDGNAIQYIPNPSEAVRLAAR